MEHFEGAVAVVTGAASGIGFALAKAAQARGAQLVIADIRPKALAEAEKTLASGGPTLAIETDVADADSVDALAEAALQRFGKVNLLINNAGVYASGRAWAISRNEYDWIIGVNLRSVINGITAFVPWMIAQKDPCHVVVVSSGAGVISTQGGALYSTTKHAVVALTESLQLDLAAERIANIGVTLVLPGAVQSQIMHPEKSAPESLQEELKARHGNPGLRDVEANLRVGVAAGLSADTMADEVFAAIVRNEQYVRPSFSDQLRHLAKTIAMRRIGECA